MTQQYSYTTSEAERSARHAERAAARKKKLQAKRRKRLKQLFPVAAFVLLLAGLGTLWYLQSTAPEPEVEPEAALPTLSMPELDPEELPDYSYSAAQTETTVQLGDTTDSTYAVLVDVTSGTILAEKDAHTVMNPASMTKVLTLLVAAEHITDLDDTFTITREITDFCFVNGCSIVGFEVDETVTVRDLLYGTILSSGADASLGLANYVAGSHEAFVELMNEKLAVLGLSETAHFTNCVGLYEENHACTIYDMAMIMKAAMENELCREILKTRIYQIPPTNKHPDGQSLSNLFLRRIEDRFTGDFQIVGGKTGYVAASGSCAVSCGQDADGRLFICATGDAGGPWPVIYDHTDLYRAYCEKKEADQ